MRGLCRTGFGVEKRAMNVHYEQRPVQMRDDLTLRIIQVRVVFEDGGRNGHSSPAFRTLSRRTALAMPQIRWARVSLRTWRVRGATSPASTNMEFAVLGKMLELLKEMAPNVIRAAAMFNPMTGSYVPNYLRLWEASSASLGIELAATPVRDVPSAE